MHILFPKHFEQLDGLFPFVFRSQYSLQQSWVLFKIENAFRLLHFKFAEDDFTELTVKPKYLTTPAAGLDFESDGLLEMMYYFLLHN